MHVLKGNHISLLSYQTAADLGVVDIHVNKVDYKPPNQQQQVNNQPPNHMQAADAAIPKAIPRHWQAEGYVLADLQCQVRPPARTIA